MNNYSDENKTSLILLAKLKEDLSNRLEKLNLDITKSHSRDSSEQAVERENDEVIHSLEEETKQELQQVEQAIRRIKQGNYRICSVCEGEIPAERLSAIPYTTLCLNCAANQE